MAVGACTVEAKRAPYGNNGPEVAICAPGGRYRTGLLTTVDVDLEAHQAPWKHVRSATILVGGGTRPAPGRFYRLGIEGSRGEASAGCCRF